MKNQRRMFTSAFKAQVATEAFKEPQTLSELAGWFDVHPNQIGMDGKGSALDNICIERCWRTIKYQHIYLNPAKDAQQRFRGIERWLKVYHHRCHQGISMTKPAEKYRLAASFTSTIPFKWPKQTEVFNPLSLHTN